MGAAAAIAGAAQSIETTQTILDKLNFPNGRPFAAFMFPPDEVFAVTATDPIFNRYFPFLSWWSGRTGDTGTLTACWRSIETPGLRRMLAPIALRSTTFCGLAEKHSGKEK